LINIKNDIFEKFKNSKITRMAFLKIQKLPPKHTKLKIK
jgi:hypothetical protein